MKRFVIFLYVLSLSCIGFAQNKATLSGYITDKKTGEAIIFATVFLKNTTIAAQSNEYGFYSLEVPVNTEVFVSCKYVGYVAFEKTITISKSQTLNIKLESKENNLQEVTVSAKNEQSKIDEAKAAGMGAVNIPMRQIRTLPTIGGELDILKIVQLMPGVVKGGEGQTGFFVRGGDADQNLILIDEATVYNPGHLFGFFSVFNPDVIKDLQLMKGGFPAQYGGRLSSVLDIKMKEGDNQKFHADGGIGLLSSRLTIQGPILKNKMSFLVSGRRTYIDQVFKLVGFPLPYYFYDVNAKLNYIISDKDRVFVSGYFGNDVLKVTSTDDSTGTNLGFGFTLGNYTQTIRWNHVFNPKLFANFTFIHTTFKYNIKGDVLDNKILIKSDVRDFGLKADYTYYKSPKASIRYGAQMILHTLRPNVVSTKGEISNFLASKKGPEQNALENAIYANLGYDQNVRWKFNAGLRITNCVVTHKSYFGLEPRLVASYGLNKNDAIKASYTRMYQYIHRVSSSSVALPTDLWYPVSEKVKPQSADQFSLGYNNYLSKPKLKLTIETWYKWMWNLVEYQPGSSLILNNNYEELLVQGKGKSYGVEFMAQREEGRFNGWVSYTLNYTKRDFTFNTGREVYWAKYDRRHNFNIAANYEVTKRFTISAIWEYISGARFTPIIGQYAQPNASLTQIDIIPIYSKRNAVRMSPTNRVDINFVFRNKTKKKYMSEWYIGGYNIFRATTPYTIRIEQLDQNDASKGYGYVQRGLFGFVFSIGWNFKI